MTRDETIAYLASLFNDKLVELHIAPPLSGFPLRRIAETLAVHAVDNLGDALKLEPQYADASATVLRKPTNSMM